jgi:hypothetical protein
MGRRSMSESPTHIPVNFRPTSRVVTLLERGHLATLSPTQTAILLCLAMNANDEGIAKHMSGVVIARRTNFRPTAITDAIAELQSKKLIAQVGCDAAGVKTYRLTLPHLDGVGEVRAASGSFDVLAYVDALVDDIGGVSVDDVRKIVAYHWRDTKKFWAGRITSEAALRQHLPTMRKQYLAKPGSVAPRRGSSYVPRVADETQDDYVPMRKGEKYVRPEAA